MEEAPLKFEDLYNRNHFHTGSTIYSKVYYHYNATTILHTHGFYEINIITKGNGIEIINNNSYIANAGDIFLMEPNSVHCLKNTNDWTVFHILLSGFFFEKIKSTHNDILKLLDYGNFSKHNEGFIHIKLNDTQQKIVKSYCDLILEAQSHCEEYKYLTETICNDLICALFAEICKAKIRDNSSENNLPNSNKQKENMESTLVKAVNYIHSHYSEKIFVQDLIKICALSKSSFELHFRNYTGLTPTQYIYQLRTRKAYELIMNGADDVIYIANECGFFDSSHLYKHFKKIYKISPAKLIAQNKKTKQNNSKNKE